MKLILLFVGCFLINHSFAQNSKMDKGLMAFDAKDFNLALTELKPYAEQGDCLAQYAVGFSYMYGGDAIKNDSLARYWLQLSADQKQPRAMGPLAVNYFSSDIADAHIKAYLWAVLGAEYSPVQRTTTARVLIKSYLKPDELEKADKLIDQYKQKWKKTPDCK
jgi:TPR repeat protein